MVIWSDDSDETRGKRPAPRPMPRPVPLRRRTWELAAVAALALVDVAVWYGVLKGWRQ